MHATCRRVPRLRIRGDCYSPAAIPASHRSGAGDGAHCWTARSGHSRSAAGSWRAAEDPANRSEEWRDPPRPKKGGEGRSAGFCLDTSGRVS
jgi:hypothetical protein